MQINKEQLQEENSSVYDILIEAHNNTFEAVLQLFLEDMRNGNGNNQEKIAQGISLINEIKEFIGDKDDQITLPEMLEAAECIVKEMHTNITKKE